MACSFPVYDLTAGNVGRVDRKHGRLPPKAKETSDRPGTSETAAGTRLPSRGRMNSYEDKRGPEGASNQFRRARFLVPTTRRQGAGDAQDQLAECSRLRPERGGDRDDTVRADLQEVKARP